MPLNSQNVLRISSMRTASVERVLKRPKSNEGKVRSPLYWAQLAEKNWFTNETLAESVMELFTTYNVVSIINATNLFAGGNYSEEAHYIVARTFAEMYFAHLIRPVPIDKGKQSSAVMPIPSLTFTLDIGGAPVLKSMFPNNEVAEKWTPKRISRTYFRGIHDAIVADILTTAFYEARQGTSASLQITIFNEYDVTYSIELANGKTYVVRPDALLVYEVEETFDGIEMEKPVYVLLEYDNGTEVMSTLRGKIAHYAQAKEQKKIPEGVSPVIAFVFNKSRRANKFIRELARIPDKFLVPLSGVPIIITDLPKIEEAGGFLRAAWTSVLPERLVTWKRLAKQMGAAKTDTEKQQIRESLKRIVWKSDGVFSLNHAREFLLTMDWRNPFLLAAKNPELFYMRELRTFQKTHQEIWGKPMQKDEIIKEYVGNAVEILRHIAPNAVS